MSFGSAPGCLVIILIIVRIIIGITIVTVIVIVVVVVAAITIIIVIVKMIVIICPEQWPVGPRCRAHDCGRVVVRAVRDALDLHRRGSELEQDPFGFILLENGRAARCDHVFSFIMLSHQNLLRGAT